MKQIVLITSALLFSILFYQQDFGINISLFTVLTITIISSLNFEKAKKKQSLLYASLYFVSALLVFINHSFLSYFTNFSLMSLYVGSISEHKNSVYLKWINGLSTIIAGFFYRKSEETQKDKIELNHSEDISTNKTKNIDDLHWVKLIGIPLTLLILFVVLYSNGNPIFQDLTNQINFKFIEFKYIICILLGYAIVTNFSKPISIKPATEKDLNTTTHLTKNGILEIDILKKETQLGTTILGLLNLLLVGYIITEFLFISKLSSLSAPEISTQLHGGIYTLIISIIIAIITILVLFRSNLNFYKNNNTLKALAFSWIFLNSILVTLIMTKNYIYIQQFGLTYKRIGVCIYLLLTVVGLITTTIKVKNLKNLWFILRANTNVALVILILCTTINWDRSITNFNLKHITNPDIEYLIELSNNNTDLLYKYNQDNNLNEELSSSIRNKYIKLWFKLKDNNWQEKSLMDYTFFKF